MKDIDVRRLERQIAYWLDYHEIDDADRVLESFETPHVFYTREHLRCPPSALVVLKTEGLSCCEIFEHYGRESVAIENKLAQFLESLGVRFEADRVYAVSFHTIED